MAKCRKCQGSGIIYEHTGTPGHPGDLAICSHVEKDCTCGGEPPYQAFTPEGKPVWCSCRSVRIKLETVKGAFKASGIPKKYLWKFSGDFVPVNDKAKKLIGMISTMQESAQGWKQGFYFWGPAGSGKTLLACILLQELMLSLGVQGRYIDLSRQFFQRLRDSYSVTDENYGESGRILDELINVPFLVIDDFGVQRNTDWESEMLYNLIDSRYAAERPVIITSNNSPEQYKEIAQGRVFSRLQEMCRIVYVDLPDYRTTHLQHVEL